ncbi:MAG: hypothetical protein D6731_21265 [Planctomycetota bacterium]|nr:MAG: hypothetical protein D6731_21265 [Planctomycetota bacterium]
MSRLALAARFVLGGVSVRVRADARPPRLRRLLARWEAFPAWPRRRARLAYDLLARPRRPRLVLNGYSYRRAVEPEDLVDLLEYEVCTRVPALTRAVPLHAAALVRDERALLLVGPSGAGKSTLARALVERGFGYVSDEQVYLGPGGAVEGMPRAIGLDGQARAWPVPRALVAQAPVRAERAVFLAPGRWPGAPLEPLSAAEALARLLAACLRPPRRGDAEALAAFAARCAPLSLACEGVEEAAALLCAEAAARLSSAS